MRRLLVDAGPLVAIMSPQDQHHQSCVRLLPRIPVPLFSCWPVITEAVWLLQADQSAVRRLLRLIHTEFLELLPLAGSEAGRIAEFMERYEEIRPDLADAALVYLAGRENIDTVFTLDRRDFSVYRFGRNRAFRILPD